MTGKNIIAANCHVEDGARLHNCIVTASGLKFGSNVCLSDAIITEDLVIFRHGRGLNHCEVSGIECVEEEVRQPLAA